MIVGQHLDLATLPLTRTRGVAGQGTITAIRLTDPINRRGLVIVAYGRLSRCYLHLDNVDLEAAS